MNQSPNQAQEVSPHIVPRECGGWLAVTPRGSALQMGVTADTETEVRAKFCESLARWLAISLD